MPDQQQQILTILLLASVAGLLLFVGARQPSPPPPPPPPPPGEPPPEGPEYPPLTPEQIAAHRSDGPRPVARAVPFYENEETWDLNRDAKGRLTSITVHRQASVSRP